MEAPGTGHLTADEIGELIRRGNPLEMSEERVQHARSCDICRRIIAMHEEEDFRLGRLAGGLKGTPGLNCPPVTDWALLAAGLVEAERREELLAHAAQCDACGAALYAVMEDFSDDLTEGESQSMDALASASPDWQRNLAKRMATAADKRPTPIRTWLPRAAAVLVMLGGGWMAQRMWMANDPARLIASAYTEQRPFEYRIEGARQAEVRQTRGNGSSFQRPATLLEAEAKIGRELATDPASVKWLGLRARAEILGWDSEGAIATLKRALEQRPEDPDLLADLGLAHALRAEAQSRDIDYSYALEYLGRSLKAKPNSPEAVFNRAVVFERLNMTDDAEGEWRRYLEMDKSGAWHDEAQRRLQAVEQKKKSAGKP